MFSIEYGVHIIYRSFNRDRQKKLITGLTMTDNCWKCIFRYRMHFLNLNDNYVMYINSTCHTEGFTKQFTHITGYRQ